jgi:tripartite ATP-independent transporter DctM subunit
MLITVVFVALVGLILAGVPIFAAMGITAAGVFIYAGDALILPMMAQRMYVSTTGFTLLAIPFFVLAGNLMNAGGITVRVFTFARALCGHINGGLGHVVVMASMIFSGTTGSAVAEAAGLGVVEYKAMRDNGYDKEFSAGVIASASTIGPVIPPSIPAVIYGSVTSTSVVKLFIAGILPGALMGLAMMLTVYFIARKRGYPIEPFPGLKAVGRAFLQASLALMMPVIIIGGLLVGLFTPTEAAVVGALYALIVGGVVYREFGIKDLPAIMWESVDQSVRVLFIIATAGFFSWMMIHQSIPEAAITGMASLTDDKNTVILLAIVILLVLGCFLEGIAVILITGPIFMAMMQQYGVDLIQFGVVMILCSMIGLLTPPVGMSLFAVCSVANVELWPLSRAVAPYLIGILAVTLVMAFVPGIALWLPNLLMP